MPCAHPRGGARASGDLHGGGFRPCSATGPAGGGANRHAYWLIQAEAEPRDEVRRVAAWIRAEASAG